MTGDYSTNPSSEDERIDELLSTLDNDALPPDEEFLAELRQKSAQEFLRHAQAAKQPEAQATAPVVWKARSVAVAVATLLLCAGLLLMPLMHTQLPPAFGEVLDALANADTLHLQVTRDGKTEELWVRQPGQVRLQSDGNRYRIAQGSRLWRIDESANSAAEEDSPYFASADAPIDVLKLIELQELQQREAQFKKRPAGRARRDGKDCHVYHAYLTNADASELRIDAFVEIETSRLRGLVTNVRRKGQFVPLSEVRVLALNRPIDDDKFLVGTHLTEDGRIGKIVDAEGLVTLKPVMNRRWTPVAGAMLLKPGDWLRTDIRGANAAAVRLEGGTQITLGPGSLLELIKPNDVRLLQGEAQFVAGEKGCTLRGPGEHVVELNEKAFYRIDGDKLADVAEMPKWLAGFEGATVNESLGSLIANVDGRNVPLTVGEHIVRVEIRDQIARTTIEETFVNHTGNRMEGVFHFPLPPDASIAGFGMWIGGELVEADVVEKQRAREIYETILREKRDPGLLEWQGGNIFKARVFPILPHSEKRIKITYTQVLPLQGNRYRYSYGLQSEMLKQTPLRELSIDLKVHSALPLASIKSPTHDTRTELTGNSGHLEFTAQEYRPERDFEAVIEVADRQADVVVIPHQRGEDGYFLLQVMPPAAEGALVRDLLPNSRPLDLLLVADTSGSMDPSQRAKQEEFIATLLSSLSPRDRFNIICCDVAPHVLFKEPVAATAENREAVEAFLSARLSLGWTDLEAAFRNVMQQVQKETQVIYVGDGIVTAKNADANDFANRLQRMYADQGTFHAVATGNSYESIVLKTLAALGGGSWRAITGESGPRETAVELLKEMSQPVLKDIELEFQGLQVAAVYPQQLPNVPAGRQQIVLGRYLPEGNDQVGEVIVSGTLGGEQVRYRSRITLAEAEEGNSFIPRLWARKHLDQLLAQGRSQEIQNEIINLSEEFHIMTPYTSLLVLETDADRERFKVKRRFQMRGGERFFAKGREDANYELRQKQIKLAGNWRLELRKSVLQHLSGMGRNLGWTAQPSRRPSRLMLGGLGQNRDFGSTRGLRGRGMLRGSERYWYNTEASSPALDFVPVNRWNMLANDQFYFIDGDGVQNGQWYEEDVIDLELNAINLPAVQSGLDPINSSIGRSLPSAYYLRDDLLSLSYGSSSEFDRPIVSDMPLSVSNRFDAYGGFRFYPSEPQPGRRRLVQDGPSNTFFAAPRSIPLAAKPFAAGGYYGGSRIQFFEGREFSDRLVQLDNWLQRILPPLPGVPPIINYPPADGWTPEALQLAQSLSRRDQLAKLKTGLVIAQTHEYFEPRWRRTSAKRTRLELVSPKAWLTREERAGSQTFTHWCDEKQRGILSAAFGLGQVRDSKPRDLKHPPLSMHDYSWGRLEQQYRDHTPEIRDAGENRVELVLTVKRKTTSSTTFLIDTARNVVLKVTNRHDGHVTSTTEFSDFVEAGGGWWARQIETKNDRNERTQLVLQSISELEQQAFAERYTQELSAREHALLLPQPLPTVLAARKAVAGGEADFADYLTMLLHATATQQWDRAWELMPGAQQAAADKPGFRWIRDQLLRISRRHLELQQRLAVETEQLAAQPRPDDLFLAEFLYNLSQRILQRNELIELQDKQKPVFARQAAWVQGGKRWLNQRANLFQSNQQHLDAFKLYEQLAREYPHDANLQVTYARQLASRGDYTAAYAWLKKVVDEQPLWNDGERRSFRNTHADLLRRQSRYADLVEFFKDWAAEDPPGNNVYAQYLDALVWNNQVDDAEALMRDWLASALQPDPLSPAQQGRIQAAVNMTLGSGYGFRARRLLEKWEAPLAAIVRDSFEKGRSLDLANRIMQNHLFNRTDTCRAIRKELAQQFAAQIPGLSVEQVQKYVSWILPNDPEIAQETWKQVADAIEVHWNAESNEVVHRRWGDILNQIYSQRFDRDILLDFLKRRLEHSPKRYRDVNVQALFNTLLQQPWSAENEQQLFDLLPQIAAGAKPSQQLARQVSQLRQLIDRMIRLRFDVLWSTVEHPEKLTRTKQIERTAELMQQAKTELAARLAQEAAKQQPPLADWIKVERMYLDVILEQNLVQVIAECWQRLGDAPPVFKQDDEDPLAAANAVLRERALLTLMNLAARKSADPALIERLMNYLDAGIELKKQSDAWRLAKYQLLIALDRPKQLEQELRRWIAASENPGFWRITLAKLMAETGEIDAAIQLFETVERDEQLSPGDYRVLASWYMVLDRRGDYERAVLRIFESSSENQLWSYLQQQLRLQQQQGGGGRSAPIEPSVLSAFRNLLRRSSSPQRHLGLLRQYYQINHEFRLLEGLAEAVIGYTPERIYPFLQGMTQVLNEVRDEATSDEILKQIEIVRQRARTDTDRRALDLLEALVERRAAELQNQPQSHTDAALAAMQRAFDRQWAPGERRLMADWLHGLGVISQRELAKEQLRELHVLYHQEAPGSRDRLHVGLHLANSAWNYGEQEKALGWLEVSLREYKRNLQGRWPHDVETPLMTYISYLENMGRFAQGETVLKHWIPLLQRDSLKNRLNGLYRSALARDGEVSLGRGAELYRNLHQLLKQEIAAASDAERSVRIQTLCDLYLTAHQKHIAAAQEDLKGFAFGELPQIQQHQRRRYEQIVTKTTDALQNVLGRYDALAFLIDSMQNEPARFRYIDRDSWQLYSQRLGDLRQELKDIGDLTKPLLEIVTRELRRDLRTRQSRNREMYFHGYSEFWAEQRDAFAAVAEEVLAAHGDSSTIVPYVANYLYYGLERYDRAIQIYFQAEDRGLLDDNARYALVLALQNRQRHGESIPLLRKLVEHQPDNREYRGRLMEAYHYAKRPADLLAFVDETDAYFNTGQRWHEQNIITLARGCLLGGLNERAVAYFEEAIGQRKRSNPRRVGDGTLSTYYAELSTAYSRMKNTSEAVNAACEAIISWGPQHRNRQQALDALINVLTDAPDRDAYAAQLDKKAKQKGQDSPIIRKSLGQAYMRHNQFQAAAKQLRLAQDLQPEDWQTQQLLLECYQKLGDQPQIIDQLLMMVKMRPREIQYYQQLGEQFGDDAAQQERAFTSIVESMPAESETHALLAEIRQSQDRWQEAAEQWRAVADIRKLEPTGLLGLARAQIHLQQWPQAERTIEKLRSTSWPERFKDVKQQTRQLERDIRSRTSP